MHSGEFRILCGDMIKNSPPSLPLPEAGVLLHTVYRKYNYLIISVKGVGTA